MSVIDDIKARLDLVELVSETVQLKRSGKHYTGFCPFHANTRTPAFVVFADSGTWRCFGQCNEGGDIFRYVMKKEGWDFNDTLKYLADKAGIQLKPVSPQEQQAAEEHARLRQLLEDAVTFYRHQLLNTPAGQQALAYLNKRGLSNETLEAWGLGYAPHSWDASLNYFKGKGYSVQEMHDAGLTSLRESGEPFDRFRHRVMIPIRDERARMSGFGARILNPDDLPKFLNSPQTPLFDKGHLLYGLDRAGKHIRALDQAVIVEGYLDVIALHQAGFPNAVSPMGTALTEHQMFLLKRYSRRIILALDPDAAGEKATLRGLQIARQAMDREQQAVFDPRGLMRYEARLQADLRVTTLPDGLDPDDVVKRDPEEWRKIIANAQPVVIHVMETLATGRNLDDPKTRSEIANQVLPLVEEVADAIERETYRQRLARLLRVDERTLLLERPRSSRPQERRPAPSQRPGQSQPAAPSYGALTPQMTTAMLESRSLGVLMRRPDLIFRVDRLMQEQGLARLSLEDFQRAENQAVFQLLLESIEQDLAEPLNFVLNSLSLPMMDKADEILERSAKLDPIEERVLEELMRDLLLLRQLNLRENLDYYRYLLEEARQQGDLRATDLVQRVMQYTQVQQRLDKALARFTTRTPATNRP